jgi:hypothetical protein
VIIPAILLGQVSQGFAAHPLISFADRNLPPQQTISGP